MTKRVVLVVVIVAAAALIGGLFSLLAPGPLLAPALDAQRRAPRRADEPPLTVEEYTPRSTLVVDEHSGPSRQVSGRRCSQPSLARCPVDQWSQTVIGEMDELNLQVLVNLSGGSGRVDSDAEDRDRSGRARRIQSGWFFFANLDFGRGVYPGFRPAGGGTA